MGGSLDASTSGSGGVSFVPVLVGCIVAIGMAVAVAVYVTMIVRKKKKRTSTEAAAAKPKASSESLGSVPSMDSVSQHSYSAIASSLSLPSAVDSKGSVVGAPI